MKKNDVKIGECYMAKVTGSEVPVRIEADSPYGGWNAKNVATGRKVRIKSAQRLHRRCTEADLAGLQRSAANGRKKAAATSPTAATGAKPAKKATNEATGATGRNTGQTGAKPAKPKRISGLTAAFMVLVDAEAEMGVKEIVEKAAEKGWWKSDAATPVATIYAAIIREIATKDAQSRFERGEKRGTFRAVCSPEQKQMLFAKVV